MLVRVGEPLSICYLASGDVILVDTLPTRENRLRHLRLMDAVQLDGVLHLGRPLKAHLIGTYDLLAQWGNPAEVCLAGLFHSVYGTRTFRSQVMSTNARCQLRASIGQYAEQLVFIFGESDRTQLLLNNRAAPYFWVNWKTGLRHELSRDVFSHLIEIEVANFIEQIPFLKENRLAVLREMVGRLDLTVDHMSSYAREAYRNAICDYMRPVCIAGGNT